MPRKSPAQATDQAADQATRPVKAITPQVSPLEQAMVLALARHEIGERLLTLGPMIIAVALARIDENSPSFPVAAHLGIVRQIWRQADKLTRRADRSEEKGDYAKASAAIAERYEVEAMLADSLGSLGGLLAPSPDARAYFAPMDALLTKHFGPWDPEMESDSFILVRHSWKEVKRAAANPEVVEAS